MVYNERTTKGKLMNKLKKKINDNAVQILMVAYLASVPISAALVVSEVRRAIK